MWPSPFASVLSGDQAIVCGVELADEMLAEARRKLEDADESVRRRVTLVQGDMRSWRSLERFDLVVVACSSITHLRSIDDQLALWSNASTTSSQAAGSSWISPCPT